MVCRVAAYKANDGELYATEEDAARADAELAIRAYLDRAGLPRDDGLVELIIDDPVPLACALASLIGVLRIRSESAVSADQESFLRRLHEGETERPTAPGIAVRSIPIRTNIYRGIE